MYIFIVFALILQVKSYTVCDCVDFCVCTYSNEVKEDYLGEIIQCSYNGYSILERNYTLPNTARSLDLSWSNLSRIDSSNVIKSNTLAELYLNNNLITYISPNALQLTELKRLDLSDNLLEYVDKDLFRSVSKLQYLNLANNRFTTFAKLTFHHLSSLHEVILDNNNIGSSVQDMNFFDRSGFGLTKKIKSLSVSGINLNMVPDNLFADAYDMRKLVISNNNINEVFELPFTLEYLDLSDNPIGDISSEDFADVPALKELKLNNLAIEVVPEYVFTSLRSLITLELERNRNLTEFSVLTFGQEVLDDSDDFVLEKLSLKGSRLSTLSKELMVPFGQLIHLDLQGNPWKCDCNLVWLKELQISEKEYDHLRCNTPKPFFNARIFDLDVKYFTCPPNKHHVGLAISIITFCVILAAIAMWLFIFLPKYQSRSSFISQMYTPSTAYTILPMSANINNL